LIYQSYQTWSDVFNGYRWQNEIYPQLRSVIQASG